MNEVVDLGEGVKVTVKEVTPRDVADIMKIAGELKLTEGTEFELAKFLQKFDTMVAIIDKIAVVESDDIKSVQDLGFSQIDQLLPKVMEVNASFLDKMGMMGVDLKALWEDTATEA